MKPIKPLYVIILVIIFAAAGFYGGTVFQKSQTRAGFERSGGQFGARFGGGQGGPGGAGMMPVRGQIVSSGDNTITVKMQDGSSKIVDLTSQTQINKTATGTTADLKSGTTVTAIGTSNSDGSVTAQTVLIGNGNMLFRRGGNQGTPTGSQ
jgi:hypothetical protein